MSFTSPFPPAHSFVPGPPVINVHSVTDDNTRVVRSASRCSHRRSKPTRDCGCGRGYVSGAPSHTHMHDANALSGLPLCSALVLMQLVQRVRPCAVLGACAYAACAAYAASAACDCARVACHKKQKTKGVRVSLCRRTGPKESIPRHPITPICQYWAMPRPVCWAMARPPGWYYCVCYYVHYV